MSCYSHQQRKSMLKPLVSLATLLCASFLIGNVAHARQQLDISPSVAVVSNKQCDPDLAPTQYQATYQITTTDNHSSEQQSLSLTLTRLNDDIIYQHNQMSFEAWNKNGEYVRYFPAEKRSISYRRGDLLALNIKTDLDKQFHLISRHGLAQLSKLNTITGPCYTEQQYHHGDVERTIKVTWLPKVSLPKTLTVNNREQTINYQLTKLKTIDTDTFKQLTAGYQDLDFADVGDSESDPFIAKMITQGFIQHGSSGFYSSDGKMLDAGHSGHQH